jgi:hypothetical protein
LECSNAIGDALDEFLSRKNVQKSEQNRKKYKKSKQSRNKPNFFPILHKFQSNNGEKRGKSKREKSNSAKIWALLLFSSLFSRLLFSRFLFEILRKNSNNFCHFMQDLYLSRHMACCCGIKMQFLRKNSNKSVKNQKREKSAKIWNTFERQSQIQLQTTNYICDYKL